MLQLHWWLLTSPSTLSCRIAINWALMIEMGVPQAGRIKAAAVMVVWLAVKVIQHL